MHPIRVLVFGCALALAVGTVSAADVPGTLACGRCRTSRYYNCYDPCERVGPIRRLYRRLFRVPCPRPVPVAVYPVAPACPPPSAPFAGVPSGRPVDPELGRPVPTTPPSALPPPSPPTPFTSSRRAPASPPPSALHFERMASRRPGPAPTYVARGLSPSSLRVLLVSVDHAGVRHQFQADSRDGLTANLAGGEWLVYTQNEEGKLTFQGRVRSQEGRPTPIRLPR